jgi:hypothetical protein
MMLNERVELNEIKIRLQSVADHESRFGRALIAKDICKLIHDVEKILDDDLYGRYEKREKIEN